MALSTSFVCDLLEYFNIARVIFLHLSNDTAMDDAELATSCLFANHWRANSVRVIDIVGNDDLPSLQEKSVIVDYSGGAYAKKGRDSNMYFSQNYFWIVLSDWKCGGAEHVPRALRLDSNFLVVQIGTIYKLDEFYRVKGKLLTSFFGTWTPKDGLNIPVMEKWRRRANLGGVRLLGGAHVQPATMMPLSLREGETTYVGFIPEFTEAVTRVFNFTLEYVFPSDNMYGSKLKNGSWGGILGLLQRGEIDVVVAGMVNLAEREEITSYITGIMFSKNVLFTVNPSYTGGTRSSLNFGAYLSVFTPGGWLLIGLAFLSIMACCFAMLRVGQGETTSFAKNLSQSVENTFRALLKLQNGSCQNSLGTHFKLFHILTALFVMVVMAYYEGMLTSFMTAKPSPPKIRSFSDILHHGYQVKVEIGTAQELDLKYSVPGTGKQKVYQKLIKDNPDAAFASFSRVAQDLLENPKLMAYTHEFAFFDKPYLQPLLDLDDELSLPVSLSLPKDSELMDLLNYQVIKMHQSGLVAFLLNKWFYQREPAELCSSVIEQTSAEPIGYDNLFFAMCIMLFGSACSLVLLIGECMSKFISTKQLI